MISGSPLDPEIRIQSAYSAQRSTALSNPRLAPALEWVAERLGGTDPFRGTLVCDQGCGRLRHLDVLRGYTNHLLLVDQAFQLSRPGELFDAGRLSIHEYVALRASEGVDLTATCAEEFQTTESGLQLVVCVAVVDVVPPTEREKILDAAARNLAPGGHYVLIAPRNDSSILRRCTASNAFEDGYVFTHHGSATFYTNYRDHSPLFAGLQSRDLLPVADLSTYRHVCLITQKGRARRARDRSD